MNNPDHQNSCPRFEIAAFLDGELNLREEIDLEFHLENCSVCTEEINSQKKFLAGLSSALKAEKEIELPADFTKVIVANAESRVSGLRRPRERFNALFICSGLFLLVILGLGSESSGILEVPGTILEQTAAVGNLFLRFVFDVALGATIILRSLCSQFLFKSEAAYGLMLFLLAISAFGFVRLMLRYKQV